MLQEPLHHAYILEGDRTNHYENLCAFCEKNLKFKTRANPDFWYEEFDRFLIEDARKLREMQLRKTTRAGKKIFVIAFHFITREAQNALLKVLEEPTDGTHIFIITPTRKIFLDTVLSRVLIIEGQPAKRAVDAENFLKSSYSKRIDSISKLVESIKEEKVSRAEAIILVQSIERELHDDFTKAPNTKKAQALSEIQKVESYLHDTSSSIKTLLEHVAVIV